MDISETSFSCMNESFRQYVREDCHSPQAHRDLLDDSPVAWPAQRSVYC